MNNVKLSDKQSALLDWLVTCYIVYDGLRHPDDFLRTDYFSPAYDFESGLNSIGVKLPIKLYHEYNVPGGGKIGRGYLRRVQRLLCLISLNKEYIRNPELFATDLVSQLYRIYGDELGDIKKQQFYENVHKPDMPDAGQLHDLENALPDVQEYVYKEMVADVEHLKQINPGLQNINVDVDKINKVAEFLTDVALGWAPEETDYFLNGKIERAKSDYEYLYNAGVRGVVTLRPDRSTQIVTAVKQKIEDDK